MFLEDEMKIDTGGTGLFIVIEGIDGAGKTTQAKLLVESLKKEKQDAVYLKEPNNGKWGKKIRHIAVHGREGVTPDEELQYFLSDREDDSKKNIIPALKAGKVVVMDRYIHSNMAYQGALGFDVGAIMEKNRKFPQPDAVFYLDISPEDGLKRISGRKGGANIGFEKIDYLQKVYGLFKEPRFASHFASMTSLDARKSVEHLHEEIRKKVFSILEIEE